MRKLFQSISILILFELVASYCANPASPTGGPKDTIPPTVINSSPEFEQVNFTGQEIQLVFDEYINADKLRQNLIITPLYDGKYKTIIKKSTITIKFEEPFQDSTTYTLNFANGITDITERTPPDNLSFSFSTGPYIDSLSLIGRITSLLDGSTTKDKFTVALYTITDSLDILKHKPTYFSKTNEKGQYVLSNLKSGYYLHLAFLDKNNNLLLNPNDESHAFLNDTIIPSFTPDSLILHYVTLDATPLKFISARPSAQYYDIRYSKPINKSKIEPSQYYRIVSENQVVRIYQDSSSLYDSLQIIVQTSDTVNNISIDTLFAKFSESSRPIEEFKFNGTYTSNKKGFIISFTANTPMLISSPKFYLSLDTIVDRPIVQDSIISNYNSTNHRFFFTFNKEDYTKILDSLIIMNFPDTASLDSVSQAQYNYLQNISKDRFNIKIPSGAFVSVQGDSSKQQILNGQFYDPLNYGSITVNIKTEIPNYTIHIVNNKNISVMREKNCSTCLFNSLKPGEYSVRVYIDQNNDGIWTPGNILTLDPPEPIINFQEFTDLRANWAIELNYQF